MPQSKTQEAVRLGFTTLCLILVGLALIVLGVIYRKSPSVLLARLFSKERGQGNGAIWKRWRLVRASREKDCPVFCLQLLGQISLRSADRIFFRNHLNLPINWHKAWIDRFLILNLVDSAVQDLKSTNRNSAISPEKPGGSHRVLKNKIQPAIIMLALLAGIHQAAVQGAQFFRISGPAATAITAFNPDGTLAWPSSRRVCSLLGTHWKVNSTPYPQM
jgi:hypothetical protein